MSLAGGASVLNVIISSPASESLWTVAADTEPTAPIEFSVLSDERSEETVLRVHGEIDLATGPALARCIGAAQARRPRRLVLDLEAVSFMDSTGLALILEANARAAADATEFALARPPRQTQRLLALSGVDRAVAVAA